MRIPTLTDWVWVQAMLNQAMIGVVSTNVRQISLDYCDAWRISVVLEKSCEQDVDDIQEIAVDACILIGEIKDRISPSISGEVLTSVSQSTKRLENSNTPNSRIVYRRKEVVSK